MVSVASRRNTLKGVQYFPYRVRFPIRVYKNEEKRSKICQLLITDT